MGTGQVGRGREGLCQCGRERRKERVDKQRGQVGGLPLGPAHTTVTGHGAGWKHTCKTDRQMCTLRPPGGPSQPVQWGMEPAHLSTLGGVPRPV